MKTSATSQLFRVTALSLAAVWSISPALSPLFSQEQKSATAAAATTTPAAESEKSGLASPWTATDTRLANHYIQLLQKDPAYGNVLDLLWDLYRKKDQTPLLLDYFKNASASGPTVARLLYAHLLRKNDEPDKARPLYETVLEETPESLPALKALARIADQQKRTADALSLHTRLVALLPPDDEDAIAIRLRKADLHRLQQEDSKALAEWNELLAAFPANTALRTEIVSLLLEAGETDTAITVLTDL
ncbi:MAG: tetratricopeptide repeat protein, partial [Verrucomicrobiaceae bacterium]|nr:tetratricopeptide repeat protein [Verrucomicrobiaceae bacterium]